MTKLLHSGFGSRNGIFAAFLSQSGMTGPRAVIEGNEGFIHALVGDVDEDHKTEIVSSIGNIWEIMDLYFKRYGCLRRTHTVVDAAIYIAEKNDLDIEAIERVEVHASSFVVELGAKIPQTLVDAQGSIPFCISLALVFKKAGIDEFNLENLNDPKIISLSKKVSLHIDPQFEKKFRENEQSAWSSKVKITLASGKELSYTAIYPSGDPENPIPEEELINKFNDMTSHALQKINIQRLQDIIFEFEKVDDLSTFYTEIME
jgi:2-methylcitrate dehydratase PrpD